MKTKNHKPLKNNNVNDESFIFNKIDELIEIGKFEEALFILDSISEDNPDYSRAMFCKSMIFGILKKENKSFKTFQKSLQSDSEKEFLNQQQKYSPLNIDNPENLFNYGLTSYYFGDYLEAMEYFDLSLRLSPNQSEAIYYKALSLGALGEFKKAIKVINRAIEINHSDHRFFNDKGAFLSELGEVEKAHECFDKSIDLKEDSYNWSNKAVLYHKCNEFKKAFKCYSRAMKLNSKDVFPVVGKAKVCMELGDFKKAEKYFDLAEDIDNTDMELLIEKGKFMLFKENYKLAIKYFDKCLKYDNKLSFVWMFKAMALNQLGKKRKMQNCIDKARKLDPIILSKFDEFFKNVE